MYCYLKIKWTLGKWEKSNLKACIFKNITSIPIHIQYIFYFGIFQEMKFYIAKIKFFVSKLKELPRFGNRKILTNIIRYGIFHCSLVESKVLQYFVKVRQNPTFPDVIPELRKWRNTWDCKMPISPIYLRVLLIWLTSLSWNTASKSTV